MQIPSKPSGKNSPPIAAPLCTITTEPRRRDRWKHNPVAAPEPADREQLHLFQ
jgi:hypothetical protein